MLAGSEPEASVTFHDVFSSDSHNSSKNPILWMRKLRCGDLSSLNQSHIPLDPGVLTAQAGLSLLDHAAPILSHPQSQVSFEIQ